MRYCVELKIDKQICVEARTENEAVEKAMEYLQDNPDDVIQTCDICEEVEEIDEDSI